MGRKQSLKDSRIVITESDSRLPTAGSPDIQGVRYNPNPVLDIDDEANDVEPVVTTIEAPRNLEVVSQTIRFAPDGTQYVTVVVQFDEVDNAEYYETRISKT